MLSLRDTLASHLLERGIEQWKPGELPRGWIERHVTSDEVYLLRYAERLIGSVTLTYEDRLVWGEDPDPAGYVHTLMIDRNYAGHGLGKALLGWCEAQIRQSGIFLARLDCVKTNSRLRRYYQEVGYRLVGFKAFPQIPWARETALFEKRLT